MTGQQAGMDKQVKVMLVAVRGLAAGYLWTTVVISIVIGLLIGLLVGWVIWPANVIGARPARLSNDYQQVFLQFAADSYASGGVKSLDELAVKLGDGWTKQEVITQLGKMIDSKQPGADRDRLAALRSALTAYPREVGPNGAPAPSGGQTPQPPASGISPVVVIGVLVIIGASVALVWIIQRRSRAAAAAVTSGMAVSSQAASGDTTEQVTQQIAVAAPPVSRAQGAPHPVQKTAWAGESTPPLAQYVTSYALGDDRYDVSFSIETSTSDFLGECGVGISELIGTGSPDKVTALEVWLFDKNDIRTLTKVFMSENAYNDQALRARLAPKGEAVLVKKGEITALTTQTLKVNARIVDLQYGSSSLPANSFFQQITIELAAWSTGS